MQGFDLYEQFATDAVKEVEGVWQEIGGGVEFLVARQGNRKYNRLLNREVEKHQRALDAKTDASESLSDGIMIDVVAQTLLLGWRTKVADGYEGTLRFKGATLPYSVENARSVLAVKDIRALVNRLAADVEQYRVKKEAEVTGN